MRYRMPSYAELGAIGSVMNPLLIDPAIALGPTSVIAAPDAGYVQLPHYNLAGWREAMDVFSVASFLFPA